MDTFFMVVSGIPVAVKRQYNLHLRPLVNDMPTATKTVVAEFQGLKEKMTHGNDRHIDNETTESRFGNLPGGDRIYYYYSTNRDTQHDLDKLVDTLEILRYSCWYHGAMSSREARKKLSYSPTGTFLVRDSQDPKHLFSLSVKTPRGTTSVRIEYTHHGKFRLDADQSVREKAPSFDCVVKLIAFYMNGEKRTTCNNVGKQLYWLEPSGRKDTPVKLVLPLKADVPTLQHMCRLSINRSLPKDLPEHYVCRLPLPTKLKLFLNQYPYLQ
ncbi:suppressor of cytokine signaling 2-like [Saccoglossus kowalevskii]|uniref:Cytokine-inducible SH2-containing protein-like n=1 Tax=Saccoglossus kowalevskii TaxID=10224 RepID=A0ABM0GMN6_SACKO|nr:PREDICTED: cytokine-inducible SH2-containing protein-like [Saccoglossus kowalevskii]